MILLRFSYLIIIANFLFFLVGFTNNIGIVGSYLGFLGAIGTDPIIIFYAIIIGAGLVVHQSKFSILYFILAAVVGAAAAHYFLGTKMFIIDVVRFDALLIMPALIVIVASFFTPKTKSKIKYTELPIHRPIRILTLIFTAVMVWVLFLNEDKSERYYKNKTIFSKYVTKHIISNTAFADREVKWCMRTNEPRAGFKVGPTNTKAEVRQFRKLRKEYFDKNKKDECKFIHEEIIIMNLGVTKEEINKAVKDGRTIEQYRWNYSRLLWRRVTDWTAALIAIVAVWKLRFCIAYVITRPMFTPKQKPTKSDFNLSKTIKNLIKKI
tara:strand:- start:30 stop:998 length:969 start_codon:yes stop_codon:yes gene_type:complete